MKIKYAFFVIVLKIVLFDALGADVSNLQKADSLFEAQKYTEAYAIYEEIFMEGHTSSSMLLKMAYIQDATDNYPEALYFLDKYYMQSADRHAVGKIEELAEQHSLSGYQYDDMHYFLALSKKYHPHIIALLLFMSLFLLVYSIVKFRNGERSIIAAVSQALVLVLLLVTLNFPRPVRAIIRNDQTLLRTGPSAGAESVDFINKGHKVIVLEQSQVWAKVVWDGENVFIRNNRLKII